MFNFNWLRTLAGLMIRTKDGKNKTIHKNDPIYNDLAKAVEHGDNGAVEELIFATEKSVVPTNLFTVDNGLVTTTDSHVEVPEFIKRRLTEHSGNPDEVKALEAFWEKLSKNTNKDCQDTLLDFLERNKCPLTLSGDVVLWKGLDNDYKDQYTHKIDMGIGKMISWYELFPNIKCTSNRESECVNNGFHCGSRVYATGYGTKTVLVLVNPSDILAVPSSYTSWKLRTTKFYVWKDNPYTNDNEIPYAVNGVNHV